MTENKTKKDLTFEEFSEGLVQQISKDHDIPIEVLKTRFGKGDSLSEDYLNRAYKHLAEQRRLLTEMGNQILENFMLGYEINKNNENSHD